MPDKKNCALFKKPCAYKYNRYWLGMKKLPIYQVDAFTSELFCGNPAAVIPVDVFPSDELMQAIALENNLSETAFVKPRNGGDYDLRWFTPTFEIDFCGHATIASTHVLINELNVASPILFHTKIGALQVEKTSQGYEMRAPHFPMHAFELTHVFRTTFNDLPNKAWQSRKNIFLMFPDTKSVVDFQPDFRAIKSLSSQKGVDDGVIIMSAGDGAYKKYDFVSRYFVPAFGIDEDPVTGSNHASLAPFWGKKLGKTEMLAYQASARGGEIKLRLDQDFVYITGQAITYLRGEIYLP